MPASPEYYQEWNKRQRQYKRDWMWRKRHPGIEPPPYKEKNKRIRIYFPENNKGNEKWQELTRQEEAWIRAHQ